MKGVLNKSYWRHGWVVFAALTIAACATTRVDSMRASAQRLEDRSDEFYSQIRYTGDNSYRDRVSRDALALSEASRDLNRAVERRASSDQVALEYDRVVKNYRRLQDDLADEGYADQNRRVLEDFDRVTTAFRDVEAAFAERHARADTLDRERARDRDRYRD